MLPMLYLKIAGAAAVVCFVGYIYYALNDRASLQAQTKAQQAQIQQYQESMARDVQIREGINDAISKIKITSNNYIKQVDSGKPLNVPDGTVIELVPGGMLVEQPSMPTYANVSSNSRSTNTTPY